MQVAENELDENKNFTKIKVLDQNKILDEHKGSGQNKVDENKIISPENLRFLFISSGSFFLIFFGSRIQKRFIWPLLEKWRFEAHLLLLICAANKSLPLSFFCKDSVAGDFWEVNTPANNHSLRLMYAALLQVRFDIEEKIDRCYQGTVWRWKTINLKEIS